MGEYAKHAMTRLHQKIIRKGTIQNMQKGRASCTFYLFMRNTVTMATPRLKNITFLSPFVFNFLPDFSCYLPGSFASVISE
jgi:hypothetical protein